MAVILALDTSTEACSCALHINGRILEEFAIIPRQHTQQILPMISRLMASENLVFSDLDAIAYGRGPGSFTGLRIAAGVAQGMAFAAGLPVVGVSTLAAMALEAWEREGGSQILSCLDARIDEIYWAHYSISADLPVLNGPEYLCKPELMHWVTDEHEDLLCVGNGLVYQQRFPDQLRMNISTACADILPRASFMVRIAASEFAQGRFTDADQVSPVYLRDKVTHQQE